MSRAPSSSVLAALLLGLLLPGCSKSPESAAQKETPAAAATPITPAHMKDHFEKVREVEEAIIRGDLEAAKAPALWIAEHEDETVRPGTERPVREMQAAAKSVASTEDLGNAAIAAANLVGACGSCHSASRVSPKLPPIPERTSQSERGRHMLEHQVAVDRLYRGLIVPAGDDWRRGAEALRKSPLRDTDLKDISKEAIAAETRVHELAERAVNAPDKSSRVTIYGSIIGACASCHGLHGRVWGPGLPKAE